MMKNIIVIAVLLLFSASLNGQISADFRSNIPGESNLALRFESVSKDTLLYSFFWDFGDGTTGSGPSVQHTYTKKGEYVVSLTVTDGTISETISRQMQVQAPLEITNVFTPNEDGFNDLFVIHTDGSAKYTLTVYSRSGTIVHRSTALTPVWDGKTPSGEKVHPGTYYYVITTDGKSGNVEKSGFVLLIRELP